MAACASISPFVSFIAAIASVTRVSASSSLGYVLKVCNLRNSTPQMHHRKISR